MYRELTNCHGFCSVYHFGTQDIYNVMVMDLLGPSLEDLFNKCSRRFTLKTVLQIADQLLERVDTLHSRHLIHRDIKPANFVIGVGDQGANVYCVDFGLSKRYRHPKNLQHIPHRDGRSLTGTPRYASINNHLGIEQSRRDDLESIGYVLIYFLKGTLPWQGLKAKNAQKKYRMILEKKQQVSIAHLCQGCPSQFAEFLSYTRSLKFDAKPDIPYLRKLFREMYHAQGCASMGKLWDWDSIDAEFSMDGGTGANAPQISANPPRPSTAAAVAAAGTGIDSDAAMLVGDNYEQTGQPSGNNRPSTAGITKSAAPQSSGQNWQQSGGEQQQQGIQRPHTAGARQSAGQTQQQGYSTQHQVQMDPRTGKAIAAEEEEEGDDAHVVAGARAMMRYRRTRASSSEPNGQGAQGQGGPGAAVAGQKGWSGQGQEQAGYTGGAQPRAIYQNPNKTSSSQQQQQLMQQQQMTRAKSSSGQRPSTQQQQQAQAQAQGNSTGWMSGGANAQSGESRPKSAGIMSALTGSNRVSSAQAQQQQQQQQQQQTLSYGSLRSRFLSGGGSGQKAAETNNTTNGKTGTSQASKLFSISR